MKNLVKRVLKFFSNKMSSSQDFWIVLFTVPVKARKKWWEFWKKDESQ